MSNENEATVMKAVWIFSGRFSGSHTLAPSVRVSKGSSLDWHQLWLQTFLLLLLLAGQAYGEDNTTTPPSTSPTNIPSQVFYTLNIFVEATVQEKNESEIIAWLEQVFQQNLETCLPSSSGSPSTHPELTTESTIENDVTSTTSSTAIPESSSTATVTTLESNIITTTVENDITNTTPATTIENSSTPAATENDDTATTAVNVENNSTTPNLESTSASASSTTSESNLITATTLERNNSTFTATTISGVTAATTTLQTDTPTTTAPTISEEQTPSTTAAAVETSTASAITPLIGQRTTSATTATTTTVQTPATATTTPITMQSPTTTITTSPTARTPITVQTTTNPIITPVPTSVPVQTPITAATQSTTAQISVIPPTTRATMQTPMTTTPTSAAPARRQTTTAETVQRPTTTSTIPPGLQTPRTAPTTPVAFQTQAQATTTPAAGQTPTSTTELSPTINTPTTVSGAPATAQTRSTPASSPTTIESAPVATAVPSVLPIPSTLGEVRLDNNVNGSTGPRSNPVGAVRKRREANGSMTQSSGIINNTSKVFQGMDVMCANKTFTRQTECIVTLRLNQTVPPCCILRSLCAGNKNSSGMSVVGRRVNRAREMSVNCSNIIPAEVQACMYSGENNGFCDADAIFIQKNQTDCAAKCTCSAFCHRNDSYYAFNVAIRGARKNVSGLSSLISTITTQPSCSPDSDGTCSSFSGAFKNSSVNCENTARNLQNCSVILRFANSVEICSVARAVRSAVEPQEELSFDGVVARAALCGHFGKGDEPFQSQFTFARDNRGPGGFCRNIEESNYRFCQNKSSVAVLLREQCDVSNETMQLNSTTMPPNATSAFNTTTPQLNTTDTANGTTANTPVIFNSTTTQPNTTENINATTANVTETFNSTTTTQPNTTDITNSTTANASMVFNSTTQQPNITQTVNATTVNVTMIFNSTTPQPNTTQMANATTPTATMIFNSTTQQPNTTQNVNATTTNSTLTLNSTRPTARTTPSANTTAATPQTTPAMNNTTTTVVPVTQTASPATTASAQVVANELLNVTRDISRLNSSQVNDLVSQLESLLSVSSISMELANTSVHIVSNLLEASPETLTESSDRIIRIVDTVGLRLELDTEAEVLVAPLLSLAATPIDGTNFQETSFSVLNPSDVQVRGDRVRRVGRSVRVDSSIPQASITLPPSLTQDLTPEEQQQASRLHFNFYQRSTVFQDSSLGAERRLNSGILGANVANLSLSGLQDNVTINLRHLEPTPANFVATCVFWDTALNDGSGGWNPDGCGVVNSTDNETICGCNHLTSFAILLNLGREPVTNRLQATILTFITYIGCGISAIFLSITLLTYLAFGKLRKDIPSKILIQLCFALLLLNLVFLVDAWLALYPDAVGLCISTAWFLHYFLLVSFTWMGVEAFHMYQALVKVFNSHISYYMLRCSVVGWGVPMIVVIIVIAIDIDNYGLVTYARFLDGTTDDFCWLRNDIAFYVAVVAYFCVIFVFNFAMFIVVLVQLYRIRRANPHNNQHRSTIQDVRSVSGITILLGLTWGFAFFAWGPVNLPFMYLFAIFNSLQGFFVFVFYCAVKENVRRQWRTYLCCGKLRLAENSEWSRTATQKTAKRSSVTNVTSVNSTNGQNSSSSSTFLVRDSPQPNNGVENPLQDTAITADEDTPGAVDFSEDNSTRHRNRPAS